MSGTLPSGVAVVLKGSEKYNDNVTYLLAPWLKYSPDGILYPENATQVEMAVKWAAQRDLTISIAGGRHGGAGYCNSGSYSLDLSKMKEIGPLDEEAGTLRVSAGVLLGEIIDFLGERGHVAATGVCPTVGAPGWALGGGYSPLSKMLGLGCDNVVAFNVVSADGTSVVANETSNPELFWALRGAGGNSFGVITSMIIKVEKLASMVYYTLTAPLETDPDFAAAVMYRWQTLYFKNKTWTESALSTYSARFGRLQLEGPMVLNFELVYVSDGPNAVDEARNLLAPLTDFVLKHPESLVSDDFKVVPFREVTIFDDLFTDPLFALAPFIEAKLSLYLKRDMQLEDWRVIIAAMLSYLDLEAANPLLIGQYFVFEPYAGKVSDGKMSDTTAHFQRGETLGDLYFDVFVKQEANEDESKKGYDAATKWLSSLHTGKPPRLGNTLYLYNGMFQSYVNYAQPLYGQGVNRWPALLNYYGGNLCELVRIKKMVDPHLRFDHPQGIPVHVPDDYDCNPAEASVVSIAIFSAACSLFTIFVVIIAAILKRKPGKKKNAKSAALEMAELG